MMVEHASKSELTTEPMQQEESCLAALDIGSGSILCGLARIDGTQATLIATETAPSFGIRSGEIIDLERASESIRIAVMTLSKRTELPIERVTIGFGGDVRLSTARGVMSLDNRGRPVTKSDVHKLRKSIYPQCGAGRCMVQRFDGPFAVGKLVGLEQPLGLTGETLAMYSAFLTLPEAHLRNILECVRRAGLQVELMVPEPLASSLGTLGVNERNLGTAVLDFGAGGLRGALWEGGRLRQIHIHGLSHGEAKGLVAPEPGGMEGIALALARRFRIAPAMAAKLMLNHGAVSVALTESNPRLQAPLEVASVDEHGVVRIDPMELGRSIEELLLPGIRALRDGLSHFNVGHAGGVVLTGQGAWLAGLTELVSRLFGNVPVRLGVPRCKVEREFLERNKYEQLGPGYCALSGLITFGTEYRLQQQAGRTNGFVKSIKRRLQRLVASF